MENEIFELLERKINEVYSHFQEKLNIESGDIRPEQLLEQDELLEKLSILIKEVLMIEKDQELAQKDLNYQKERKSNE